MKKSVLHPLVALLISIIFLLALVLWKAPAISKVDVSPSEQTVKILLVGDIMPSRWVDKQMETHGYDFPFEKIRGLLRSYDIVFGNLESPVTQGPVVPAGSMKFRTDPEFIPYLKRAGFNILSLANNHIGDQGPDGVRDTLHHLTQNNIFFSGAGTSTSAYAPTFISHGSTTIAFIAQNDRTPIPHSYCAGEKWFGSACFDRERLAHAIAIANEQADFTIVSLHAGDEYTNSPNSLQTTFAHLSIDLGADMVIGHHPHWVQSREMYKGKWIYYSLGNFIFDQEWSRDTKLGLALGVELGTKSHDVVRLTHTIIRVDQYAQPSIASAEESLAMFEYLELP